MNPPARQSIHALPSSNHELSNEPWSPSSDHSLLGRVAETAPPSRRSVSSQRSTSLSSTVTDGFESAGQPAPSMTEADSPLAEADELAVGSPPPSAMPAASGAPQVQSHRHVIRLSSIEHTMPRAYIRVCLAYRLPPDKDFDAIMDKLNRFTFKLLDAKPYLTGYVVPATEADGRSNVAEIQFSSEEFLSYPGIHVRRLTDAEMPYTYEQLDAKGLPPSLIRPDLISALPEGADGDRAAVFRMQANVVKGGLIISVYLHHCISDGAGLGFLVTGKSLDGDFNFDRQRAESQGISPEELHERLAAWCTEHCRLRSSLSWIPQTPPSTSRHIKCKRMSDSPRAERVPRPRGQGTVFTFSKTKLDEARRTVEMKAQPGFVSSHDTLLALLWYHMTLARKASVDSSIHTSKLFIPVNIRSKLTSPLSESYFGAAVDFACAELSLSRFSGYEAEEQDRLAGMAVAVHQAICEVDEPYIRQLIAFANVPDPEIDVRDVMATNMNRSTGADMYITSWEKLGLYEATFGMDLGRPDWVRKPWSKDPGSCVVLPRDERKANTEVLVQMTEEDMSRLLRDDVFMSFVVRVIDGGKVP